MKTYFTSTIICGLKEINRFITAVVLASLSLVLMLQEMLHLTQLKEAIIHC
jgi:hypothetical protein